MLKLGEPLTECPYEKPSGGLPTAVGNVARGRGQRRPQPWATLSAAMGNAPQALQQRENASPKRLGIWQKCIYIIDIRTVAFLIPLPSHTLFFSGQCFSLPQFVKVCIIPQKDVTMRKNELFTD